MLIRLSVVVASKTLAGLLCEALSDLDALVQTHPLEGDFWEQASAPSDVLLVSLSRLPKPAVESVRLLSNLPGGPKIVVLMESEDAELRSMLFRSGADTVLDSTFDMEVWWDALQPIIARSRAEIEPNQLRVDRAHVERSAHQLKRPVASQPAEATNSEDSATNRNGSAAQLDWLPNGWLELPWTQLRGILLSACEHEYIHHHLTQTKGRVGLVAKRAGLSNRAVSLMMNRQGLRKEPFRNQTEC